MDELYEIYALKYAEAPARTRREAFMFDDDHASPCPLDYFVWVLRSENRTILVDTGYDTAEAKRRDRPIIAEPVDVLRSLDVDPGQLDTVVITHLHYDHAGTLDAFPNARFHLQAAEMAYATGPCMCPGILQIPFTAEHACSMVRKVYSGRVQFHDGEGAVAPGVTVHLIGGHSRGLQCLRVKTARGWVVLASDASHFYENFHTGKPFPIVVDMEPTLRGYETMRALAESDEHVIPGHDPLVTRLYPQMGDAPIWRLDQPPSGPFAEHIGAGTR